MPKKPRSATTSGPTSVAIRKKIAAKVTTPEVIERRAEQTESIGDEGANDLLVDPDTLRTELESMSPIDIDPDSEFESNSVPPSRTRVRRSVRARGRSKAVTPEIVDESSDSSTDTSTEISDKAVSSGRAITTVATSDPIAIYLAEIRKYPLLTREQEQEVAIKYRETGDAKAAEMLVTSNLRFVVKIAAEYSRFGAKLIDLVQEGNVGLMHAVKEFNPYKGVRLITYAVWWIRGYIQEYLMRQYSLVRIGTTQNQRKLFYRLQKERESLSQSGQEPTHALLAGRLGVSEAEVQTMSQRLSGRDLSLSQPLDNSGASAATLLDFEATEDPLVDETLGLKEELAVLKENLEKIRGDLSTKETYILETRLLADEPLTLQEIGEHFGITREAVRQLEARLIGKIRTAVIASLNRS